MKSEVQNAKFYIGLKIRLDHTPFVRPVNQNYCSLRIEPEGKNSSPIRKVWLFIIKGKLFKQNTKYVYTKTSKFIFITSWCTTRTQTFANLWNITWDVKYMHYNTYLHCEEHRHCPWVRGIKFIILFTSVIVMT